jgi:hypothetical protein
MPAGSVEFIEVLRSFAQGLSHQEALQQHVDHTIRDGPRVIMYDRGEPDVVFTAELDAAMYLDMALDGPEADMVEARGLASSLAVLLASFEPGDELLGDLMMLARDKRRTSTRLRSAASSEVARTALERYVGRRSWPPQLSDAILSMDAPALDMLADLLDGDAWQDIRRLIMAA